MDKVDATMATVNEQRELANEIAETISAPLATDMFDDEDLKAELEELEQDELNERLSGAERVPVHLPAGARAEETRQAVALEDDEEAQLKELQAALAM